jgi:hypothetical protein
MKRLMLALACISVILASAVPASAHVSEMQISPRFFLFPDGDISFRIWVACTEGEQFDFTFRLRQDDQVEDRGQPTNPIFNCDGGPHPVSVRFGTNADFDPGLARATVRVLTSDGDTASNSREVRIIACPGNPDCPT